jgi:hypothetical protein
MNKPCFALASAVVAAPPRKRRRGGQIRITLAMQTESRFIQRAFTFI